MAAVPPWESSIDHQMHHVGYQGTEDVTLKPPEAESLATLLIRHLPEAIPYDTLSRFFSPYGATLVRPCTSERRKFFGKVLSVQRASNKPTEGTKLHKSEAQVGKDFTSSTSLMKDATGTRDLNEGSKPGSLPSSEPIAVRLGIDYLFPPDLEI